MTPPLNAVQPAALVAICLIAWFLVRIPRGLFAEVGGRTPTPRLEWGLTLILGVAGIAAFVAASGHTPLARLTFAVVGMTCAAIVYSDVSFLAVPNLYSLVLAVLTLIAPWKLTLGETLTGALVCGGLMAALAFIWRTLKGVEGLGFGDVKLAAVVGALLGARQGLLAISLSAAIVAVLAYGWLWWRKRQHKDATLDGEAAQVRLIPYGAAMALASMAFLAKGLL